MQISGASGGMPSMSQIREMQQQMFKSADANNDGALSLDEFTNAKGPEGASGAKGPSAADKANMFKQLDANGDGKVTAAEMSAAKPPKGSMPGSDMSSNTMSALLSIQSSGDQNSTSSTKASTTSTQLSTAEDKLLSKLVADLYASKANSGSTESLAA